VGAFPPSAFVRSPVEEGSSLFVRPTGKVGAFFGGAAMSAVAGAVATTFFGEGTHVGGIQNVAARLQRNWKLLAATAVAGGIVGAVVK
jgi:hypothetical protein